MKDNPQGFSRDPGRTHRDGTHTRDFEQRTALPVVFIENQPQVFLEKIHFSDDQTVGGTRDNPRKFRSQPNRIQT